MLRSAINNTKRFLSTAAAEAPAGLTPVRRLEFVKPVIDVKFIQDNVDMLVHNAKIRNAVGDPKKVAQLASELRAKRLEVAKLREARNKRASQGSGGAGQEDGVRIDAKALRQEVQRLEGEVEALNSQLLEEAMCLPNITHPDVPLGPEPNAKTVRIIGSKPEFTFTPKDHVAVVEGYDAVDFTKAASVSGSRFHFMRNGGAMLELELVQWAMKTVAAKGFTPMLTPDLIRSGVVDACGFQARGEQSQVYDITDSELSLTGTAELPLAAYYMNSVIPHAELPIKMVAFSHCFRREAGAAGKQAGGLYRLHQFSKVEMFVICNPADSDAALKELVDLQCELVSQLGLHARVLMMPTEELGASAYQKFDIEAWMPARNGFGEITSATNCLDYQSRRLGIRWKDASGNLVYPHTLNATACAVPRVMLSLLETHQQADGSVVLPPPLSIVQPWFTRRLAEGKKASK